MACLTLPYTLQPGTLAYLKAQPLFVAKSMRDVQVPRAANVMEHYLSSHNVARPEAEAIRFYTGNAIWAEISKRYAPEAKLPPEVYSLAEDYVKSASNVAQRLSYYLMLIITRESRHVHSTIHTAMTAKWGSDYTNFNHGIKHHDSMGAKTFFLDNPPAMTMGDYAEAISWTFHNGGFKHSYGGPVWAQIADVFNNMVQGEYSPEMLTDVSWALAHNTGPIFNKGMVYSMFDKQSLKKILDVQRGGQMPEAVFSGALPNITPFASAMVNRARDLFPGVWEDSVDWQKVEDAGAVQSYQSLKVKKTPSGKVYWISPDFFVPVVDKARAA